MPPLLGTLLSQGLKLGKRATRKNRDLFALQKNELLKMLKTARHTQFGNHYHFDEILQRFSNKTDKEFYDWYKSRVPVFTYNKIDEEWWYKLRAGEKNVCWPGVVRYFALSSGTSESSSKYIPLTKDLIKANKRTGVRQILSLAHYDLPKGLLGKGILMLGGSTELQKSEHYYAGDLSGIQTGKIPFWFNYFYKPGRDIAKTKDWNQKLEEITLSAKDWDIGFLVGVPAWIQLLMEKIISHYKVKHIHEIWPNLEVFVHGGVSFEPYKKGFEKLLGKPITYIETYLASEGFLAFQALPTLHSMRLQVDNGIFFEFVPFNDENFNSEGELVFNPKTIMIDEVEEGIDYAILITTNAGAWRYMIGDTVRFVDKKEAEIIITGRTKHFLSVCGEHLSVDNMNKAVQMVSEEFNISIREFTVSGIPFGTMFAHQWYLGVEGKVDKEKLCKRLDECLCLLNDDYRTERTSALKEVLLEVLPLETFYDFMKKRGKIGGQSKFPRVMKKVMYDEWRQFVQHG